MNQIPIWIDCDPGVDDAAALLLANACPTLKLVGVSTVAGNVNLQTTTGNALRLSDLMDADYPVFAGAAAPMCRPYHDGAEFHGANGLGGVTLPEPGGKPEACAAWDGLYAAAEQYDGTLEVVTMGPLTNIAIALSKYPKLAAKIRRILMMGGAAIGGNRTPCAEYNIFADPEAAQAVFRSGVPIVMCGLDVTHQTYLLAEELEALGKSDSRAARFVCESSRHILQKNLDAGHAGWCVHDACPIAYLIQPECFEAREAGVFVETQAELTLGKTVTDLYSDKKFPVKNALVVLSADRKAFVKLLTDALLSYSISTH